jgi:hypothetical protein
MEVPTMTELMRLTRAELCGLETRVTTALPKYPEGSPERTLAAPRRRRYRAKAA